MGTTTIQYRPRVWAAEKFHQTMKRFLVMILHRRAGKTTAIVNHHQRAAMSDDWEGKRLKETMPSLTDGDIYTLLHPKGGRHYGHIMPLKNQAKLNIWDQLKEYAGQIPGVEFFEADLLVRYPTGNKLQLFGADNPDALRGPGFSGLSFDEYSQHPSNLFSEVLSKSLADHLGYAIFSGTIKGRDQLFRMHQKAKDNPEWFALWQDLDMSLATEDDITVKVLQKAMEDDIQLIADGLMTQADFDQEWYLSADAAIKGAWFGAEMAAAKRLGRITRVPHEPLYRVDTWWDIGVDDHTSIWFTQTGRKDIRIIDFYENSDQGLPFYITILNDKQKDLGYTYGKHWGPHDIKVRDFGTGKSRQVAAKELGVKFEVVPNLAFADGINAVRLVLPKCYFDEKRCEVGLDALRQYRRSYNKILGEFTGEPVHNKFSHAADSFRMFAVGNKPFEEPKDESDSVGMGYARNADDLSWMGS